MREYMLYTNGDSFQINAHRKISTADALYFYDESGNVIAEFFREHIVGWEEKREDVK